MRRVLIYDRFDAQVCELSENDVFELTRHEVVNGAHELTITTTQVLEKGYRVLMEDDRGYWHEWCVSGIDEQHANGSRPYGSYYCVWSLQPDLMGTRVSAMPGVQTPVTAAQALLSVLSGTSRWTRGTVTNTNTGGASMYDTDGWSAMSTLVANWGGEVDTTIGVSSGGAVSRQVDLYAQHGESTAKRRFDFGADLVSVRRTIADDPLYCRITPRGKGELTEGGSYGRKITIESVNDGKDYLENASMVDLAKLPDGNGGWEYPTLEVENSECETPADLLAWAQSVLDAYTNPKVTYEVNVVQAAKEGIDLQGVSLGDEVQIVDGKFNDLRLTGRVMEITIDELAHTTTQLTIGNVGEGISERFSDLYSGIKTAEESVTQLAQSLSTADYIDSLLDRINAEINATGGYAYIVPGNGILTFDVAVADPLNPVEASRVVEIKGGSIRIANSKTAQGAWEWKTVFTSGHIAGELVTAAQITTGYIGSSGGTFIDLDNNTVQLGPSYGNVTIGTNSFEIKYGNISTMFFGQENVGQYKLRVGRTGSSYPHIILNSDGNIVINESDNNPFVHFGKDVTRSGSTITTKYHTTVGLRASGSTIGDYSTVFGKLCTASGEWSHAEGNQTTASGQYSHALNNFTTASGASSTACGLSTTASGSYSFACGQGTLAGRENMFACGKYNANTSGDLFEVGNGTSSSRANAFRVTTSNTAYVGSTQVTSDRRVKTPLGEITEAEATEFVRQLKPSKFEKFGRKELGFYAQDVEETNLGAFLVDESNDHGYEDFKNLSYDGLIAPLVAYVQSMEKRVESLETRLSELEEKIGKE